MVGLFRQYLLCSACMAVVAVVFLLAMPLLSRRASARSLYAALLLVIVGFLVPVRPVLPVDVPLPRMQPMETIQTVAEGAVREGAMPEAAVQRAAGPDRIWPTLCALWIMGMAAVLSWHIIRHLRFMRTVRRWRGPIHAAHTHALFQQEARALHIRRIPALMVCTAIDTPMLVGFFRPAVLLPAGSMPDEILRMILRHELVHYKRGDLWMKLAVLAATAVHWFNPVLIALGKALSLQCEISCDAAVVRQSDMTLRQRYGEAVIGIVRRKNACHTALSTTFDGGIKDMKQRIFSLVDMRSKRMGAMILCSVLMLTLLAGAAGAGAAVSGPDAAQVSLLHWDSAVKPLLQDGSTLAVHDPVSGNEWQLKVGAMDRHCDAQPETAADTEQMNAAFGNTKTWSPKAVYVKLPGGTWTMATMHNTPHDKAEATITDNGFNGVLCVHFLRDMAEAEQNDPNYGVLNQEVLREGWKELTGEDVP